MDTSTTTRLVAIAALMQSVGCGPATLPPAQTPAVYEPAFTGIVPAAKPKNQFGRLVIDARGPQGEPGAFQAGLAVFNQYTILCAKLPCVVDLELGTTVELEVTNFDVMHQTHEGDFNLESEFQVSIEKPLAIILVNVGRRWPMSENNQAGSMKVVDPSPSQTEKFLPPSSN
jgi:hypothetical protein